MRTSALPWRPNAVKRVKVSRSVATRSIGRGNGLALRGAPPGDSTRCTAQPTRWRASTATPATCRPPAANGRRVPSQDERVPRRGYCVALRRPDREPLYFRIEIRARCDRHGRSCATRPTVCSAGQRASGSLLLMACAAHTSCAAVAARRAWQRRSKFFTSGGLTHLLEQRAAMATDRTRGFSAWTARAQLSACCGAA